MTRCSLHVDFDQAQIASLHARYPPVEIVDGEVIGEDVLDHFQDLGFVGCENVFGHVVPFLRVRSAVFSVDAVDRLLLLGLVALDGIVSEIYGLCDFGLRRFTVIDIGSSLND